MLVNGVYICELVKKDSSDLTARVTSEPVHKVWDYYYKNSGDCGLSTVDTVVSWYASRGIEVMNLI